MSYFSPSPFSCYRYFPDTTTDINNKNSSNCVSTLNDGLVEVIRSDPIASYGSYFALELHTSDMLIKFLHDKSKRPKSFDVKSLFHFVEIEAKVKGQVHVLDFEFSLLSLFQRNRNS